ncbi:hypothetical protein C8R47DRAFT_1072002 [Mycena vitilis]|nr:hypothetical protein C8R47DRAFT_1072002 [Mycena vitilis]
MSDRRTRCPPLYYPSPGGENTFVVDNDPDGKFYLVGKGRAVGIFNNPNRANEQTDGYSGYVKKSAKRWAGHGGARELWDLICDEYHRDGCPPQTLPAGFTAPTPVNRPNLDSPSSPAATPALPTTPRRSTEVPSSVSLSPMRAPPSSASATSSSFIPAYPPPPYHRISPTISSRARPRVAPLTPVPSATRAFSQLRAPAAVGPSTPSNSGYSSDEDSSSDIELAQDMWAIEGLPGKLFVTKELAFANAFASRLRNPRYASGTDTQALLLFSRGLL